MNKHISHYKIIKKLGEGGMGRIFLAEDTNLKRKVALKLLPSFISSDSQKSDRFTNEAQAAAALNHPHIAQIYTIEQSEEELFIVMEYIRGKDLKDIITADTLEIEQKIEIASQIAKGLKAAHEKGIIHRDIKSSNIMLDEDGNAKILDFGLARIRGTEHITKTGTTFGTAAYMPPEQIHGKNVDEQSDIWSLGVVLYELFTGELPFKGAYEATTLYSITQEKPAPVTELNPEIPGWLAEIIHNCLEKEKKDRYGSIDEILNNFDVKVNHKREKKRAKFFKSTHISLGVSVAVVLILLIFSLNSLNRPISSWFTEDTESSRQYLTILPFKNISKDSTYEIISEGLVETLSSKLSTVQRLRSSFWVIPPTEIKQKEVQTAGQAHKVFNVHLAVTGSIQPLGNSTRFIIQLIDAKELRQLDSKIIDVPSKNLTSLQNKSVEALLKMLEIEQDEELNRALRKGDPNQPGASEFYVRGRAYLQRTPTRQNINHAMRSFHKAIEKDSTYALAYAGLGESYWKRYVEFQDIEDVDKAKKHVAKALELNSELAPVKVTMGIIHLGAGEHEEALQQFHEAIETNEKYVEAYLNLAKVYDAKGQFEEAEETYKKAIALQPDFYRGYNSLGSFYLNHGQYSKAIKQFLHVSELTPDNPHIYSNLGVYYMLLGQSAKASDNFEKSLSIDTTYIAASNFGSLKFNQGKYFEAITLYKKALELSPNDYRIWGNLALACDLVKDTELNKMADKYYKKAIKRGKEILNVNPKEAVANANLGAFHASIGDTVEALNYIERALSLNPDNMYVKIDAVATYELTGYRDKALQWVNSEIIPYIKSQPRLKSLVKDKRFQQMVEQSL